MYNFLQLFIIHSLIHQLLSTSHSTLQPHANLSDIVHTLNARVCFYIKYLGSFFLLLNDLKYTY